MNEPYKTQTVRLQVPAGISLDEWRRALRRLSKNQGTRICSVHFGDGGEETEEAAVAEVRDYS